MKEEHVAELSGIDGANPVGFLAALGLLRILNLKSDTLPRLSWTDYLRARLHLSRPLKSDELSDLIVSGLRDLLNDGVSDLGEIIGVPTEVFESFIQDALVHSARQADRNKLIFACAYGSTAIREPVKGTVVPTLISFSNGQGGKLLLKDFRTLVSAVDAQRMHSALFEIWKYADRDSPTFRWDPVDMRMGAHMATDPGSTETRSVAAANALAFVGMSFLITAPVGGELRTTGFRSIAGGTYFTWPLWSFGIGDDAVACLLQKDKWERGRGIVACFGVKRIMFKKNLYFSNAVAMDGSFPGS